MRKTKHMSKAEKLMKKKPTVAAAWYLGMLAYFSCSNEIPMPYILNECRTIPNFNILLMSIYLSDKDNNIVFIHGEKDSYFACIKDGEIKNVVIDINKITPVFKIAAMALNGKLRKLNKLFKKKKRFEKDYDESLENKRIHDRALDIVRTKAKFYMYIKGEDVIYYLNAGLAFNGYPSGHLDDIDKEDDVYKYIDGMVNYIDMHESPNINLNLSKGAKSKDIIGNLGASATNIERLNRKILKEVKIPETPEELEANI